MKHIDKTGQEYSDVRRRAEEAVRARMPEREEISSLNREEVEGLIHELRVHQIELETQNETLRLTQDLLSESRDRYSDLYDFAPVGYFTLTRHGIILEANLAGAVLLGWDRSLLIGVPFSRFVTKSDSDEFYRQSSESFRSRIKQQRELRLKDAAGHVFYARMESLVTPSPDGAAPTLRMIVSDISDLKQAEAAAIEAKEQLERKVTERTEELRLKTEELARSNMDLERFAYVASHDLQEPLRNVANALLLLERINRGKLGEESRQLMAYAVDGAKKMKSLITDLLEYSRVTTQGRPFANVDTQGVVEWAIKNLKTLIEETGVKVICSRMPTIWGDRTQLLQVFQNLIANAVKFGPSSDPLARIGAYRDGNEWVFFVEDNGIGIDPEHFDRVFVIFQQLTKRTPFQGTGMGLAIVKRIVERHGGRVWVESEKGVGSKFYFTVPLSRT